MNVQQRSVAARLFPGEAVVGLQMARAGIHRCPRPGTQETAWCTEQTEGPRRGPQEAPSRSGPAGSVRAGRL